MKHSIAHFLAAAMLLSLPLSAQAHDPKAFDRMMDAPAPEANTSACDELKHRRDSSSATDLKALEKRCSAEKEAAGSSPDKAPTDKE